MKHLKYILTLIVAVSLSSCADYLDIVPDDVATIEHAFTDRVSAERFLATIYSYMPRIGDPAADPAIQASDEYTVIENSYYDVSRYYGNRIKLGEQNINNPIMNYWNGANGGRGTFVALRECNIFLENINSVGPDLYEWERERWIAEVIFFKAFYHYNLLRMYGPIPLIKDNKEISAGVEEVKVYREPFDECIDYIVELCDEAMATLPLQITNIAAEAGRITKPIAAMLKAEVLVLAASPLFNGNTDFNTLVDNRGIKLLGETEDLGKWSRAATACKEAIDIAHEAGIRLFTFNDSRFPLSEETRRGMSIRGAVSIRWNEELIWGNPVNTVAALQSNILPYMKFEDITGGSLGVEFSASFTMAELFYSKNGVPINEDPSYDYAGRYGIVTVEDDHYYYIKQGLTTAALNTNREPRFYANLGFDCGYWYGNGRTKDVGTGSDTETPWIMRMKAGEVSGKNGDIRYTRSGYFPKKPINFETATSATGSLSTTRYTYPVMRLADLYLLYAEALNESLDAPNSEVYEYVDIVRKRAGLNGVVESWRDHSNLPEKPFTKTGMRDIIRQERMIELCFESKRFWDLRRWKLAHVYHNQPERGWNVTQNTTEGYYQVIIFNQLEFPTRQYLWPIREDELRRNINLVQNPYWN
ncbi:MAG: RagB/SusD family nutrient uptake outer membrane protein [Tannerella sp.]|jgi:hypothetical protein|nr:RagB/SusD family nutrient uptake outer membrane protein [Tannerella sp.]